MPMSFIQDPAHWRQRAEESRMIAERMKDPENKRMMLKAAEDYDKLAECAEQRLKAPPQSK